MLRRAIPALLLVSLILLPAPAQAAEPEFALSVNPERAYYQPGDVIRLHLVYNGTRDQYFVIYLGPYLRLLSSDFQSDRPPDTPPKGVNQTRVRRVSPLDPVVDWSVLVLPGDDVITDTWFEVHLVDLSSMNVTYAHRYELEIVNVSTLVAANNELQQTINELNGRISVLTGDLSKCNLSLREREKEVLRLRQIADSFEDITSAVSMIKVVPTNISVTIMGKKTYLVVDVPYYWDPLRGEYVHPQEEDIRISGNQIEFRFPWTRDWGEEGWFTPEEIKDPYNLKFRFGAIFYYVSRSQQASITLRRYWSWAVAYPLLAVFLIGVIAGVLYYLIRRAIKHYLTTYPEKLLGAGE